MSKQISKDRREIVVISSGIAAGSAGFLMIAQKHPMFGWVWMAVIVFAFAYVIRKLVLIKRSGR